MPKIGDKEYSYSAKGITAYKKALKKLKKKVSKRNYSYGDQSTTGE